LPKAIIVFGVPPNELPLKSGLERLTPNAVPPNEPVVRGQSPSWFPSAA
jgi:hypothetical protein